MRLATVLLLAIGCAALAAQDQRVVVSKADLVRMAETGLPVSLIVKTVESADELPVLQPADITDLASRGVAPEVLEAVVERKRLKTLSNTLSGKQPALRRLRVTATLGKRRGLLGGLTPGSGKPFAVYWGAAAVGAGGAPKALGTCPREPACWCGQAEGDKTCVGPGSSSWDARFSCFRAVEMEPGRAHEVFRTEVPSGVSEIRVYAFYITREKNGSIRLQSWRSLDVGGEPAALRFDTGASDDYSAEADLTLSLGRNADTDMRIAVRRFDNRESERSDAADYVEIVSAPEDLIPSGLCAAE